MLMVDECPPGGRKQRVVAAFANRAHEVDVTDVKEVTDHGYVAAHVDGR